MHGGQYFSSSYLFYIFINSSTDFRSCELLGLWTSKADLPLLDLYQNIEKLNKLLLLGQCGVDGLNFVVELC